MIFIKLKQSCFFQQNEQLIALLEINYRRQRPQTDEVSEPGYVYTTWSSQSWWRDSHCLLLLLLPIQVLKLNNAHQGKLVRNLPFLHCLLVILSSEINICVLLTDPHRHRPSGSVCACRRLNSSFLLFIQAPNHFRSRNSDTDRDVLTGRSVCLHAVRWLLLWQKHVNWSWGSLTNSHTFVFITCCLSGQTWKTATRNLQQNIVFMDQWTVLNIWTGSPGSGGLKIKIWQHVLDQTLE